MAPAHPQSCLCPACVLARQCGSFCWSFLTLHPWVQVRDIPAIVFGTIDHRIDTTFFKYAPDWLKVGAASECLCRTAHKQPSPAIFIGHSFPAASPPPIVHGLSWAAALLDRLGLVLLDVACCCACQNQGFGG